MVQQSFEVVAILHLLHLPRNLRVLKDLSSYIESMQMSLVTRKMAGLTFSSGPEDSACVCYINLRFLAQ